MKVISTWSAEGEAEIGTVKSEFRTMYIESLDFVGHLIDFFFFFFFFLLCTWHHGGCRFNAL